MLVGAIERGVRRGVEAHACLEIRRGEALTTPIELRGTIEAGGERRLCGDCTEGAERRVNLDGVTDDRDVTIRCADIERSRF